MGHFYLTQEPIPSWRHQIALLEVCAQVLGFPRPTLAVCMVWLRLTPPELVLERFPLSRTMWVCLHEVIDMSMRRVCFLTRFYFGCCVGYWWSSAVKREGIWSYDRQAATLRVVGPGFSSLCSHGQWLHGVSNFYTLCGPMEILVFLKFFVVMFFSIALTKLDILDTLSDIKVGVAYTVDDKPLDSFPGEIYYLDLQECSFFSRLSFFPLPCNMTLIFNCS